ncbi:hypothetical protein KIN20_013294 [Parelaphostrongylus tenuis]|uniref:Uncharacterized protein n=1 Tax=Parelaphostrongylus tenuis TaxID=148309 RepID=A0AAD5MD95_PARTN|nr:hypothetical protein KIN20_013294 [Parelaphostrongylus tenuis]
MWPVRILIGLCLLMLASTLTYEGIPPYWPVVDSGVSPDLDYASHQLLKRGVVEVKRREAIARARCFFNPITC